MYDFLALLDERYRFSIADAVVGLSWKSFLERASSEAEFRGDLPGVTKIRSIETHHLALVQQKSQQCLAAERVPPNRNTYNRVVGVPAESFSRMNVASVSVFFSTSRPIRNR